MTADMAKICRTAAVTALLLSATTFVHGDTVDVREWLVPWAESGPASPVMDAGGRIWFLGSEGDYIANFSTDTAEFNRYDLRPGTAPVDLLVDTQRTLWFASHRRRLIGRLDPSTARVTEFDMPGRKAGALRSMAFDRDGNLWFTSEGGDVVGRLRPDSGEIDLVELPGRRVRPYGIAVNRHDAPWVAAAGAASLFVVDPVALTADAIPLPNEDASPHRVAITSDDRVWYTDPASGGLGRYDPASGEFAEWVMPGGPGSHPLAIAADRYDRLWIVESGRVPNRLIGFDTGRSAFLTTTDIPSGAGMVSKLYYHEPTGEIWFATATNYIGRAVIH